MIPNEVSAAYCYGEDRKTVLECPYFTDFDCPMNCKLAKRLSSGIIHQVKTGLERFVDKWGYDWRRPQQ